MQHDHTRGSNERRSPGRMNPRDDQAALLAHNTEERRPATQETRQPRLSTWRARRQPARDPHAPSERREADRQTPGHQARPRDPRSHQQASSQRPATDQTKTHAHRTRDLRSTRAPTAWNPSCFTADLPSAGPARGHETTRLVMLTDNAAFHRDATAVRTTERRPDRHAACGGSRRFK